MRAAAPVVTLLMTMLAAGCSGPGGEPAAPAGNPAPPAVSLAPAAQPGDMLAGTSWRLVEFQSMDDAQGSTKPSDPSLYTMQLNPDGSAAMRLNCNRATGSWTAQPGADASNGQFEFGPLAGTRALCPPPSLDEMIVRQATYVRGYALRDGRLYLSLMADGGIFVWEPLPEGADAAPAAVAPTAPQSRRLPASVADRIRKEYSSPDTPTRFLSGSADLNGDGRQELLVHVVGPMACGSGGCPTLVFTPGEGETFTVISTITISRPPIRISPRSSGGWRNLIVEIGGGGGRTGHAELPHDGKGYPGNPTVPPARRITDLAGAETVIDDFDSFDKATPLPPQ